MINYITAPFKWFFKLEAASGLMLLIAAVIALIISNTDLGEDYFNLLNTHIYACSYLLSLSVCFSSVFFSKNDTAYGPLGC